MTTVFFYHCARLVDPITIQVRGGPKAKATAISSLNRGCSEAPVQGMKRQIYDQFRGNEASRSVNFTSLQMFRITDTYKE